MVQVMDRMRVLEVNAGLSTQQYELFPDISIGDAPVVGPVVGPVVAPVVPPAVAPNGKRS